MLAHSKSSRRGVGRARVASEPRQQAAVCHMQGGSRLRYGQEKAGVHHHWHGSRAKEQEEGGQQQAGTRRARRLEKRGRLSATVIP